MLTTSIFSHGSKRKIKQKSYLSVDVAYGGGEFQIIDPSNLIQVYVEGGIGILNLHIPREIVNTPNVRRDFDTANRSRVGSFEIR